MADYWTQCSFVLSCTPDEAQALHTAINEPDTLDDKYFDDPDYPTFEVQAEIDPNGIWIWGEEAPQVYYVGMLIRDLAPSALPCGFVFASTCSKPRLDSFDGGYVLITEDGVEIKTASELLAGELGDAKL